MLWRTMMNLWKNRAKHLDPGPGPGLVAHPVAAAGVAAVPHVPDLDPGHRHAPLDMTDTEGAGQGKESFT